MLLLLLPTRHWCATDAVGEAGQKAMRRCAFMVCVAPGFVHCLWQRLRAARLLALLHHLTCFRPPALRRKWRLKLLTTSAIPSSSGVLPMAVDRDKSRWAPEPVALLAVIKSVTYFCRPRSVSLLALSVCHVPSRSAWDCAAPKSWLAVLCIKLEMVFLP